MKMIGCNHFICHLFTECPYIASYENGLYYMVYKYFKIFCIDIK